VGDRLGDRVSRVGQAVFGYDRGHRLLGTSIELPAPALRVLREVSDARFSPGTARYVAALPLPETQLIAAVSTWRAPDAPRIGSVWAHVLLIETNLLAKIPDLTVLLAAFRRPAAQTLGSYREPLDLTSVHRKRASDWPAPHEVERIVAAVYSTDEPVALEVHEPEHYEGMLFALWSQQWPVLRRRFSFRTRAEATGASAERFSVQLAERLPREMIRSAAIPTRGDPWVGWLAGELRAAHGQPQRFLWHYGSEAGARRTQLPALYEVKHFIESADDPEKVVGVICDRFPEPEQMVGLKRALLGPANAGEPVWKLPEERRLRLALTAARSFDLDQLEVWPRLASLAEQHSRALPEVLAALPGRLEGQAAHALAAQADLPLARSLLDASSGLGVKLLRQRPDLLAHPDLWASPNSNREVFVKIATRAPETERVVLAALHAQDQQSARDLLEDNAALAVRFLNALAIKADEGQIKNATVQDWLRAVDEAVTWPQLNWRRVSAEAVELLLASFAPEGLVERVATQRLLNAVPASAPALRWPVVLVLAALGETDAETGRELWLGGFGPVHRALAEDRLPDELWEPLDRRLPERGNWDRCRRLRKALAKHIKAQHWSREDIEAAVADAGPEGPRLFELLQSKKKKPWYEQVMDLFS
jgi:hypothetical protein